MNSPGTDFLLKVERLCKRFSLRRGLFPGSGPSVQAVDELSLEIGAGQIVGLVGESGSGKSTLGRAILQLTRPESGAVYFHGLDLCKASTGELNAARKKLQIIFQDSLAALSPRRTILESMLEPLEQFEPEKRADHWHRCAEALTTVGLDESVMGRFPHELSSGQRQRVGIARAILTRPDLIIADEAVSALDVSVQAQVLELIRNLRADQGIAFLFISHDLAVISQVADVVAVMLRGQIVESAPVDSLFKQPLHPYTRELLAAVPDPDPAVSIRAPHAKAGLSRQVRSNACVFADRCASVMAVCREQVPAYQQLETSKAHHVRCHLYPENPATSQGNE